MPTTPRQSRRVGPAITADGTRTTAYQACLALTCSDCGRAMAPEDFFSRRSRKVAPYATGQLNTVPICTTCRPLQVVENDGHG